MFSEHSFNHVAIPLLLCKFLTNDESRFFFVHVMAFEIYIPRKRSLLISCFFLVKFVKYLELITLDLIFQDRFPVKNPFTFPACRKSISVQLQNVHSTLESNNTFMAQLKRFHFVTRRAICGHHCRRVGLLLLFTTLQMMQLSWRRNSGDQRHFCRSQIGVV